MTRVLIEASEVYRNTTGISRYSRALIRHLPSAAPDLDLVFSPPDYARRTHTRTPRTALSRFRHLAQHLYLTQIAVINATRQRQPGVIHSLNFFVPLLTAVPRVTTFFDLAYFDIPHHTDRFWGFYGRQLMPLFARQSAAIITPMAATKEAICRRFGVRPERVHVVGAGVDPHFRPVTDAAELGRVRLRYNLPLSGRFALYVGAWHAPKNLPTLIEAFTGLEGASLLITGQPHTNAELGVIAQARASHAPVQFLYHVPESDLPTLYTLARVVVLPSLYEGFGLPVIEAMACGTPVICSDIPILREVTDGAAALFPPEEPDILNELLKLLLFDEYEHLAWRSAALARSATFDWRQTAAAVAGVWRGVAG
ncbi:MAG TPA: glycosyltransferase family 1 protein [Aggregatilineales bacterium]|nr:glycosyltransferase family 4 protein [Anaerolineales bacterium]HRE49460.1 glycosyltransferase family 1 protein [Aggregatilineales bacterium]